MIGKRGSSGREDDAEFAEKPAGGVDPHGARRHPCRADPVEGCQLLLTLSFDWNGTDVAVAPGFEHAFDVGPVGFRTLNVGTYSERRQQFHIVAEAFELASPVMCGATGFHNDGRRRLCGHKRGQFSAGQTVVSGNVAGTIRNSNLENGFCQIDSDGRILHRGFLLDGWFSENRSRSLCHRSEEHTSELQSPCNLVCRLLLEKKKNLS